MREHHTSSANSTNQSRCRYGYFRCPLSAMLERPGWRQIVSIPIFRQSYSAGCSHPRTASRVNACCSAVRVRWRAIIDQRITGRRFEYQSKQAALLFASARRIRQANVFAHPPQQSDYVSMWATPSQPAGLKVSRTVHRIAKFLPTGPIRKLRAWREERRSLKRGTVKIRL